MKRVVFVDGLMCVGKTTLLIELRDHLPSSVVVPEVLPELRSEQSENRDFYIRNDLAKIMVAHQATAQTALVDRSILSTVAYSASYGAIDWARLEEFLTNAPLANMSCLFVYMDECPRKSFARASHLGRLNGNQWSRMVAVEAMALAFRDLFVELPRRFPGHQYLTVRSSPDVVSTCGKVMRALVFPGESVNRYTAGTIE